MIHIIHELFEAEHKIAAIFRVIVHSSVYLAFGSVGLAVFSTIALGLPHYLGAYIICFLMIFAMYNMNRYSDINEDIVTHPNRYSFTMKYRKYIELSAILAVLISLIIGYLRNLSIVFIILLPLVLAILYSFRWIPKNLFRYQRLKDVPLVKNILIAFCWAIIVWVVIAYSWSEFNIAAISVAIIIFTRFFINTVMFDIRDTHGDKKHGTHTLPVLIGVKNTRLFLYSYLTALVLFTFIVVQKGILPPLVHLVNLTSLQAYYYIYLSDKDVPIHTLCDVVADGEFIVMGIAAIIGSILL